MSHQVDYLNNSVWCRLAPSPIHGIGVFAIRDIPKGKMLTDYNYNNLKQPLDFIEIQEEEFDEILPEIRSLILDRMIYDSLTRKFEFVSPNHDQFLQSFMNHSDDPNSDGQYALRDIECGEEVTENFRDLVPHGPHRITRNHQSFAWVL